MEPNLMQVYHSSNAWCFNHEIMDTFLFFDYYLIHKIIYTNTQK